ncbi:hypothetical protein [Allosalinactinospora lopnorensis]
MQVVEPGIVPCPRWRPERAETGPLSDAPSRCGVGRKAESGR